MVQSIGNRAGFEHSYFEILQVSKCLDGLNWLNDNYCFMILDYPNPKSIFSASFQKH